MARDEENCSFLASAYMLEKMPTKDEEGSYVWKLRDELSEALEQVDLTECASCMRKLPEGEDGSAILVLECKS